MTDIVPLEHGGGLEQWDRMRFEDIKAALINHLAPRTEFNDTQWRVFMYICKRRNLDPFVNQIYPVKFHNNQTGLDDLVPIVGIDGFRAIAERTGRYAGGKDVLYDDGLTLYQILEKYTDPEYKDKQLQIEGPKIKPRTATSTVLKLVGGHIVESVATIRWSEWYNAIPRNRRYEWNRRPFHMAGFAAERQAIRKAFPVETAGLVSDEEIGGVSIPTEDTIPQQNRITQLFDKLGFNEASRLDYCMSETGKSVLGEMNADELDLIEDRLIVFSEEKDETTENQPIA